MSSRALIFTDLDGCLLDHHNYSFDAALPILEQLRAAGVPVIPNSSKTCAEILRLREALENTDPFICENGAAVFIPVGYFTRMPAQCTARNGLWVREFGASRQACLQFLDSIKGDFAGQFTAFHECSQEQIQQLTELDAIDATLAAQRDYSEPIQWLGNQEQREQFIARANNAGLQASQGGRFLTLSGGGDKGTALRWLRATYLKAWDSGNVIDLAVGDSPNDTPMLESTAHALVITVPGAEPLSLNRDQKTTIYIDDAGPQGWAKGVSQWLQHINHNRTEGHSHG